VTTASTRGWPTSYVIRVSGHLDPHWAAIFGLALAHEADGTTTLTGAVADQAALHGNLARIRDLGVTLISVTANDPRPTP
jgi:hypothetical protein